MGDYMHSTNVEHLKKIERKLIILRWLIILFISPSFFFLSEYKDYGKYFLVAIFVSSIYNFFLTFSAYSKKDRYITFLKYAIYIDLLLIAIAMGIRGGLRSDIYFLYFLAISFNGAKLGYRGTIVTLCLSILSFTINTFFFTDAEVFSLGKYIFRLVYLPLISLSITEMNLLVQDSHSREQKAKDLACTDPLTGLPNRLLLSEHFEKMIHRYQEKKEPFTVILFDLDDFKKVNDTNGHMRGDQVLITLTDILKNHITSRDFACRLGGEEFLVLFANCSLETAYLRATHIRQEVATYHFNKIGKITISGGVNLYQEDYSIIENINFADEAMYAAKRAGKNQIVTYQELNQSA